ncbi:hypothetical protein [Candidatus Protochlamydia amoebophila]|uniref:hypothetical protein n=1 Tax=Candidatus Protochlamydia amoebophila TaxID=362787 RepID=UPI001BC9C97A|nr:hypothetical protein [Candidatus Protochlamydia amoebophila]
MCIQNYPTFFNYYNLFPSEAPTENQRRRDRISSLAIGILVVGIIHTACALVYVLKRAYKYLVNFHQTTFIPSQYSQTHFDQHLNLPSTSIQLDDKALAATYPVMNVAIQSTVSPIPPPSPINSISETALEDLSHLLAEKWNISPLDNMSKEKREINRNKPFIDWINAEYKFPQACIRQNLEALIQEDKPILKQALFLGIRGDGDCTSRVLCIGLMLQAILQNNPLEDFHTFCQHLLRVLNWMQKETKKSNSALHLFIGQQIQQRFLSNFVKLSQIVAHCTKENIKEKILACCQSETFNREMIVFLKAASALYLVTHRQILPEFCSHILLGEVFSYSESGDELQYFQDKIRTDQPNNPALFGNLADAYAIGQLFQQSIAWIRVEEKSTGSSEHRPIIYFDQNVKPEQKPFYILNRPGHSDLLLI